MIEDLGAFISSYGYIAVFIGCFIEGEAAIILGSFAAIRGYLDMPGIMVAAFLGTVIGDNTWFWLGRRLGRPFMLQRRGWRRKARRIQRLARDHGTMTILSVRFLYGFRSVTPFVLGAARVHPLKFLLLEMISAVAWVVLVTWLARLIALAASSAVDLDNVEWLVVGIIVGVAVLIWSGYLLYSRRLGN